MYVSTQTLTEMSTKNVFLGVKATGVYFCQLCHLHVPTVLKGTLTSWNYQGLNRVFFFFACVS